MEIRYRSTRGRESGIAASTAILNGIAGDGGLYVPETIPSLAVPVGEIADLTYQELAYAVMRPFLSDFSDEEVRHCIDAAYDDKFDTPAIAPIREAGGFCFLELFHGKTLAFKDMALSILPHFLVTAAKKAEVKDRIIILTATSGDTGKAAMAGFEDVPGTEIIVFYPRDGVSPVQQRQMITQTGANTHVIAIPGNFDDAQNGVKKIFTDPAFAEDMRKHGCRFSSANSINIGRLVPQIVYYVYAYGQLAKSDAIRAGDPIDVTVPTGNFGNILAAWYAKQMGLPIRTLICASNDNKVLFDFFRSGTYDKRRPFLLTTSPSMDILISSNLERLLYHISGEDTARTAAWMRALVEEGTYAVSESERAQLNDFFGGFATEDEVAAAIARIYGSDGYVIDTHTAVAAAVAARYQDEKGSDVPMVVASTASPYKFGRSVLRAIDAARYDALSDDEQFTAMEELSGVAIPPAIRALREAPVRHTTVCEIDAMADTIRGMLWP